MHRRALFEQVGGLLAVPTSATSSLVASKAKPRIKIGQIGVGHAHASKLSVYRRSDDYEVIGVVESDERLREEARDKEPFRGLPFLTREQLLNVPGLQAVLVETRVANLLEAAEACVDAGCHVHLDKPAGESLPRYAAILKKAARKKLWIQMGYMYRYNPAVVLLRELLKQGSLGEVFEVHAVMSKVVPPVERKALAVHRGGIMFELGCHLIDLVVGILGTPDRVTPHIRRTARFDDTLADNMLAVLDFPKATATIRSTALEVDGGSRRHLAVCGTEGTFHIQPLDNPTACVVLANPPKGYRRGYQDITFPKYVRYVDDAADMARVIRGEKEIDFTAEHDLSVQKTVLLASDLSPTD